MASGAAPRASPRIFVCYRRDDTSGYAGRLFDALVAGFGEHSVFMDIDAISPGADFVEVIEDALRRCDVVLALIGPHWLSTPSHSLNDPEDYLRLEIEGAIKRRIRILPILVGGALMPNARELPPSIAALARRNAYELSDRRWHSDVRELIALLGRPVTASGSALVAGLASSGTLAGSAKASRPKDAAPDCSASRAQTSLSHAAHPTRDKSLTRSSVGTIRLRVTRASALLAPLTKRKVLVAAVGIATVACVGVLLAIRVGRVSSPTPPEASQAVQGSASPTGCIATTFCVAVGDYSVGANDQALIETRNESNWTMDASSAGQSGHLSGISCVTSRFCFAVGYVKTGAVNQTLIEAWDGKGWAPTRSNSTSNSQGNELLRISCTSTSFCMAVGKFTDSNMVDQPLAEQWNGTKWDLAPPISTSPSEPNLLDGVSCASATFCMAVGAHGGESLLKTLVEEWNGTTWTHVMAQNPGDGQHDLLHRVSCTSTSFCMAVGQYRYGASDLALVEEWNGSSWDWVQGPNGPRGQENELFGISCLSRSFCTAVGRYRPEPRAAYRTLIGAWGGHTWNTRPSPDAITGGDSILYGVSCIDLRFCIAAGYYMGGHHQTLIEEWNGTSWQLVNPPNSSTSEDNYLSI